MSRKIDGCKTSACVEKLACAKVILVQHDTCGPVSWQHAINYHNHADSVQIFKFESLLYAQFSKVLLQFLV